MTTSPHSDDISITYRPDAEITDAEDGDLRRLLSTNFPWEAGLVTRRFVHEMPGHRWLVRASSGELVAHVAVHDKLIAVGGRELRIAGVAEVCVASPYRGRGIVPRMLVEAHAWMEREAIPFSMLFGNPRVYGSSGYMAIESPLIVDETFIQQWNPFKGKPMIRPIAATEPWPAGVVDLRGPSF
jgi:hypothetical protein